MNNSTKWNKKNPVVGDYMDGTGGYHVKQSRHRKKNILRCHLYIKAKLWIFNQ